MKLILAILAVVCFLLEAFKVQNPSIKWWALGIAFMIAWYAFPI